MLARFSIFCRSIHCRTRARTGQVTLIVTLLASGLILAIPLSSARAQTTVTPVPTATSPGEGTELAPGGWQPSSDSYPAPGTVTTSIPTQIAVSPTPLPPAVSPSPTIGGAATVTPGFPTPIFPTLTPNLTLAVPVITTTSGLTTTATLIPLPALTLVFPKQRVAALLVTATPDPRQPLPPWTQPQRLVPLALVGMIWVILAGWFYYAQREL